MAPGKLKLPFKIGNKQQRQAEHIKRKRTHDSTRRDERFRRKRDEEKNPALKAQRLKRNIPLTLDRKRTWDEVNSDAEDEVGLSVDVERLKRRRKADNPAEEAENGNKGAQEAVASSSEDEQDDLDSMVDFNSDDDDNNPATEPTTPNTTNRAPSPTPSTASTNLTLTPTSLSSKFPTLFPTDPTNRPLPKILITTSLNSTLHTQATLLTTLFPHSTYIRRSAHRYAHKFSIREIASFASSRAYTALILLKEDQKRPTGLTIVHLPQGPTFHFNLSNWIEGKRLPGHGNPTNHVPELLLNNFRTPIGLLAAHMFQSLFPPQPELQGRQVVTLHNQRDYIFLRRHRYVFRDRRESEKEVVGNDGKAVKGAEGIRTGLQELGPRFTLKLRRIDRGIQRGGEGGVEWEWKGGMEKERTKFQL